MQDITDLEARVSAHLYNYQAPRLDTYWLQTMWFDGHKRLRDALGRKISVHYGEEIGHNVIKRLVKYGGWKGE